MEFFGHFSGGDGSAEVVPLDLVAAMGAEERHLLFNFNPFGNYFQIQALCHADDGGGDGHVAGVGGNVANEGAIDFEFVDAELLEVAEAGVAVPKSSIASLTPICLNSWRTANMTSSLEIRRLSVSSSSRSSGRGRSDAVRA